MQIGATSPRGTVGHDNSPSCHTCHVVGPSLPRQSANLLAWLPGATWPASWAYGLQGNGSILLLMGNGWPKLSILLYQFLLKHGSGWTDGKLEKKFHDEWKKWKESYIMTREKVAKWMKSWKLTKWMGNPQNSLPVRGALIK